MNGNAGAADAKDGMMTDFSLLMIDERRMDFHWGLALRNKNKVQTWKRRNGRQEQEQEQAHDQTRNGYKGIDWQWQQHVQFSASFGRWTVAKSTQVPNVE